MITTPSAVLAAIEALVRATMLNAKFTRGAAKPSSMAPGGHVVMNDGVAGDPEVTLSPTLYTYTHRVGLSVAPFPGADPRAALTIMLAPLAAAVVADPFLGGLADYMEFETPDTDETETLGASGLNWADVGLLVTYTTANPLG